jgi:hypothetical protein
MSYEGGGTIIGPAGPTGATGATGSGEAFTGPTGAILWYDGSAVTGTTGFIWTETGGFGNAYRLTAGPNGNFIDLDQNGYMGMFINQSDVGNSIGIYAVSAAISVTDKTSAELSNSNIQLTSDTLTLNIASSAGTSGQVLTSDGLYATWQDVPTNTGPTGATGATGETGATGPGLLASGLASFDGTISPTLEFYIPISPPLSGFNTTTTAVQVTLQEPDDAPNEQNWIVFAKPAIDGDSNQFIQVVFASPVESAAPVAAWCVLAVNTPIVPAATFIIS